MQFRFFTLLGFVAFFALIASINSEPEVEDRAEENAIEGRAANPAVKVVAKLIGSLFAGAAASCLAEAASHCKQHWRSASASIQCGKNFLAANRGRCAASG